MLLFTLGERSLYAILPGALGIHTERQMSAHRVYVSLITSFASYGHGIHGNQYANLSDAMDFSSGKTWCLRTSFFFFLPLRKLFSSLNKKAGHPFCIESIYLSSLRLFQFSSNQVGVYALGKDIIRPAPSRIVLIVVYSLETLATLVWLTKATCCFSR